MTPGLQKLLTWLSPAFPVGAFAWSQGLEAAIAAGQVHDRDSTQHWIEGLLSNGGLRNDAIILAHAYRNGSEAQALAELADLSLALTPARERFDETGITGNAFALAARAWPNATVPDLPTPCPYPVAVGALAAAHAVPLSDTLIAWLTAAIHSQVSVAVRLVPIGQTDGLAIMASLEPQVAAQAVLCQHAALDDIGGVAYAADIAQMKHETMTTRIFRS
jgi:urease accessory protein